MYSTIGTTITDISFVDVLRVFLITGVFIYAAKKDLLTREINSIVWRILIVGGLIFIGLDLYTEPLTVEYGFQVTANILAASLLAIALKISGLFGLADVKAFIAIGIALPVFPKLGALPLYIPVYTPPSDIVFPLVVLTILVNMAFFLPFAPARILYRNIKNRDIEFGTYGVWMYAYKQPVSELESDFGNIIAPWMIDIEKDYDSPQSFSDAFKLSQNGLNTKFLMDFMDWKRETTGDDSLTLTDIESGRDIKYFLESDDTPWEPAEPVGFIQGLKNWWNNEEPPEANIEDEITRIDTLLEKDEVWVTPGLPFLVPMTLAILTTIFVGDLLFFLMFGL